ncbi:MAG: hypothetical protein Q7S43_04595 [bacterium]|nr:hypothetical protein [bacterium]
MRPLVELALSNQRKKIRSLLDTSPTDLTELHNELYSFLLDEENIRIILYLPFDLLPSPGTPFADIYLKAWKRLLTSNENDLRTNFVDGDVLEPELGENPRVRKAAHLIPELVKNGLVTISEVIDIYLYRCDDDKILHESIKDVLPVLTDLGLMDQDLVKARPRPKKEPWPIKIPAREAWESQERKNQEIRATLETMFRTWSGNFLELFGQLWKNLEFRDELAQILYHKIYLGTAIDSDLEKFNLEKPNLESPSIKGSEKKLEDVVEKIKNNKDLSRILYPIVIAFGSRIKGYGKLSADLDIAVFIRPNISWDERSKIYKELGKVTEFWLEKQGDNLVIRDVPFEENNIAEKDWIHILLQGIWFGDNKQIIRLQEGLLPRYLNSKDKLERTVWLRQLELEALQYRLMHKGYARFYPIRSSIQTEHSYLIDSDSAFWDPGYRRLATKLFISRVFLPQL